MNQYTARELLRENGFKLTPVDEKGRWKANASVIALIACVNLDFELAVNGEGEASFTGRRKQGAQTPMVKSVTGALDEMAHLAVDTKYRAERS